MNRYSVSSLVGEGSFGRVYKAVRKDDDQIVAIKIISKRGRSSRDLKCLRRECDIQAYLKHPNVIEMLESFETRNDIIVVTEFALVDLHRYLSRNGIFKEDRAQSLICDLVSALYYLHSNRILHRDLKPQNVLLSETLHAKLCDFGLARNMTVGTHVLTSIKGTPLYMAPELLAERPYDHLADFWSLGCISYECLTGQPPFCTTSILHLVKLIKHEEIKWPSFLSSNCQSFLQGLLEKEPSLRISWAQILCHPFVEGKLYISGIKGENSPFINPGKSKSSKNGSKDRKDEKGSRELKSSSDIPIIKDIDIKSEHPIDNSTVSVSTLENVTSSRDSMNAIAPSDIEPLETDLEDSVSLPFAECSIDDNSALTKLSSISTMSIRPSVPIMPNIVGVLPPMMPLVNSQTCYISGNNNMILNHFNDNFEMDSKPNESVNVITTTNQLIAKAQAAAALSLKKSRNKDLEKRKLSQNLDNFSLRLNQSIDVEMQRKGLEKKDNKKEQHFVLKSTDEKHSAENTPPCLLPGWDSCDESQNPPIENEEWLAFLNRTIQEIMDGELESLKQQNLVSIIVAPLRNTKATPKVIDSVAQLLSLPFVLNEPDSVVELIKTVYADVKLVPNLMYASKLLICQKAVNDSAMSLQQFNTDQSVRSILELTSEEILTASRLYELICHLVHLKQQFLSQFCDAMAILSADELLINFFNHDFKNLYAVRISNCILALFCCVLRDLPENAELVEKIVFSPKLNLLTLLQIKNNLFRIRLCMLFRLMARFSLRGLQGVWNKEMRETIEYWSDNDDQDVQKEAKGTLDELKQFSFYA